MTFELKRYQASKAESKAPYLLTAADMGHKEM